VGKRAGMGLAASWSAGQRCKSIWWLGGRAHQEDHCSPRPAPQIQCLHLVIHELEMTQEKKTNVYTLIHKLKSLYYYDHQKKCIAYTAQAPRRRIMNKSLS